MVSEKPEHNGISSFKISMMPTINGLTSAVESNDFNLTSWHLNNGVNPNNRDMYGNIALSIAVMNNNIAITRLLLDFGANPNITDRFGIYPIQYSITSVNSSIYQLLILYGSTNPIIGHIDEELNRLN